jgi:hypothetical protein
MATRSSAVCLRGGDAAASVQEPDLVTSVGVPVARTSPTRRRSVSRANGWVKFEGSSTQRRWARFVPTGGEALGVSIPSIPNSSTPGFRASALCSGERRHCRSRSLRPLGRGEPRRSTAFLAYARSSFHLTRAGRVEGSCAREARLEDIRSSRRPPSSVEFRTSDTGADWLSASLLGRAR